MLYGLACGKIAALAGETGNSRPVVPAERETNNSGVMAGTARLHMRETFSRVAVREPISVRVVFRHRPSGCANG